ncbi:hypothetical protein BS50DRAFT_592841 [Corynespora cassiicola Philippines]|uniref:DNA-binding protein REB1 n=1 Tax=Corynespora cassiicola Philippines TaxID=1448308 RepID=A0A2T2N7B8_CORCC|nr:hypothetical protein BS50DRAFT_592841 [Corynespora cassiicola Philippines]
MAMLASPPPSHDPVPAATATATAAATSSKRGRDELPTDQEQDDSRRRKKQKKKRRKPDAEQGKEITIKIEGHEGVNFPPGQPIQEESRQMPNASPSRVPSEPPDNPSIARRKRQDLASDNLTPAEVELANSRTLQHPPDVRDAGEFTNDEAEMIRRQLRDIQDHHSLDVDRLVGIIQFSLVNNKDYGHSSDQEELKDLSSQLWNCLYETLPSRKKTAINRWVRRRYTHVTGGPWSEEEDRLLEKLHEEHDSKWKLISDILGTRTPENCRDRWRNYLQHGNQQKFRRFSEEEELRLQEAIERVLRSDIKARKEAGLLSNDWTSASIDWNAVATQMGSRSRLQCLQKWKALQKSKVYKDVAEMDWNDKIAIVKCIALQWRKYSIESWAEVNWEAIRMPWRVDDLKAVVQELADDVEEKETFDETLRAVGELIRRRTRRETSE